MEGNKRKERCRLESLVVRIIGKHAQLRNLRDLFIDISSSLERGLGLSSLNGSGLLTISDALSEALRSWAKRQRFIPSSSLIVEWHPTE